MPAGLARTTARGGPSTGRHPRRRMHRVAGMACTCSGLPLPLDNLVQRTGSVIRAVPGRSHGPWTTARARLHRPPTLRAMGIPPSISITMLRFRALCRLVLAFCIAGAGAFVSSLPLDLGGAKLAGSGAKVFVGKRASCHDMARSTNVAPTRSMTKQKAPCCNATCPDMTACASAQLAVFTDAPRMFPAGTNAIPDFVPAPVVSSIPVTLLRPPIPLHA